MIKLTLLTILFMLSNVCAFHLPQKFFTIPPAAASSSSSSSNQFENQENYYSIDTITSSSRPGVLASSVAGLSSGLVGFLASAVADDEYELAELPPVYVPVLFGLVLIVGVGILTASLGDVMEEEASLGLQSGARAKKEIERSKSSYFKR